MFNIELVRRRRRPKFELGTRWFAELVWEIRCQIPWYAIWSKAKKIVKKLNNGDSIAVISDDISAAFATVAFVAFISLLVDRTYTATQYALLASIGTAGRTTLASSSGALVDWLNGDWGTFFILTTIMVIPSLICLWLIRNKIKIGAK